MSQWREFELKDFTGLETATRIPSKNSMSDVLNLDLRSKSGDLVIRPGYDLKYSMPSLASFPYNNLSGFEALSFGNFYVTSASVSQEITILVAKATISPEVDSIVNVPADMNVLTVWASHSWNGSAWVEGWDWLNEMVLTQVNTQGTDKWKLKLDFANAGAVSAGRFNNWTLDDLNSEKQHKIVKTYDYSGNVGLKIANNGDIDPAGNGVLLMKNYIPNSYLQGMYSATTSEITFHKILDEIRIGFGASVNRLGLSVKYSKKFTNIQEMTFASGDTDMTSASALEGLSTIDGLILDPYNTVANNQVHTMELSKTSNGSYEADKRYFVRMTGVLDGFNEFLLAESSILFTTSGKLNVVPKLKLGAINKRLTSIRLWVSESDDDSSTADSPFFLLDEIEVRRNDYLADVWTIDDTGYLTTIATTEKFISGDASSVIYDPSISTDWDLTNLSASVNTVEESLRLTLGTNTFGIAKISSQDFGSDNLVELGVITVMNFSAWASDDGYQLYVLMQSGAEYEVDVYAINNLGTTPPTKDYQVVFDGSAQFDRVIFLFEKSGTGVSTDYLELKSISFKVYDSTVGYSTVPLTTAELNSSLGYVATFDYAKSWDSVRLTPGRTYAVNPYFSGKLNNKIIFSPISGDGAYMYDVLVSENFLNLEKFDGNDLMGVEVLPNMDFLAISRNTVQIVDSLTNQVKNIIFGVGCIAKRSIVNYGDKVAWAGKHDIYMSNGVNVQNLTEGSIRDSYRLLTTTEKSNIIATLDERDKSYFFYSNDASLGASGKNVYALTTRGWSKFRPYDSTIKIFDVSKDGDVWYLSSNSIYKTDYSQLVDNDSAGASQGIEFAYQSQEIDIDLIGEGMTKNSRIYLSKLWVYYKGLASGGGSFKIRLYLDGSATEFKSFTLTTSSNPYKESFKLPVGALCERFKIRIDSNNTAITLSGNFEIYSVGALWKPIAVGVNG